MDLFQNKCSEFIRILKWLYDYGYSDPAHWNTRGEAGWTCPLKLCDNIITIDEVVGKVEQELKIGRERNWSFYDLKLEDYLK